MLVRHNVQFGDHEELIFQSLWNRMMHPILKGTPQTKPGSIISDKFSPRIRSTIARECVAAPCFEIFEKRRA
jgi:hypothetical protein